VSSLLLSSHLISVFPSAVKRMEIKGTRSIGDMLMVDWTLELVYV
jgi:hypothetical protein